MFKMLKQSYYYVCMTFSPNFKVLALHPTHMACHTRQTVLLILYYDTVTQFHISIDNNFLRYAHFTTTNIVYCCQTSITQVRKKRVFGAENFDNFMEADCAQARQRTLHAVLSGDKNAIIFIRASYHIHTAYLYHIILHLVHAINTYYI